MPGLNTQLMLATARARFCSFQIRLPKVVGARSALSMGGSLPASGRQQLMQGTPLSCPPALFLPASDDPRDIEMQHATSEATDSYLRRICDAIGLAHTAWRQRATLVNVVINAAQASGGTLRGAGLGPEIRQFGPREEPWHRSRTEAIATAIGTCWDNWQQSVSVPGLPWYPAFAAMPSPAAPPTPNFPMTLMALRQSTFHLSSSQLKRQMLRYYAGDNQWPNELFEAVAFGFEKAFQLWHPMQMVTNVMGTGPVPTFAPPYVPVGPVVGGTGTQIPGAW